MAEVERASLSSVLRQSVTAEYYNTVFQHSVTTQWKGTVVRRLPHWSAVKHLELSGQGTDIVTTSIDRNQPEKNQEDLSGQGAIERIVQTVSSSPNCFFCSGSSDGQQLAARPMNVRKVSEDGSLWFLGASDSALSKQLEKDNSVHLFFQGAKHAEFLQLEGVALMTTDPARIDELWEPILKTWFTEGPRDPRIVVIQVVPHRGHYWDQKHGGLVAGTKMMLGALLGVTLDDSIQGELRP